jgi:hypothetical protein
VREGEPSHRGSEAPTRRTAGIGSGTPPLEGVAEHRFSVRIGRVARGFLITPFSSETAGGEDPATFARVQEAIGTAANETGLDLRRADDIFAAGVVIQQVRGEIEQADLILAVCTGRNANVFFELGLAEAAGKPQILVAASKADLPFDIHLRGDSGIPCGVLNAVRKS